MLLLAALASAVATALVAGGARAALVHLGVAATGAGLLLAAGVTGLGELAVSHAARDDATERAAIRALWSAVFADLRTAALVAALAGALVAAAASSRLPAGLPSTAWRRARRLAGDRSRGARAVRAAVLIAVGAAIVAAPGLVGRIALVAAGLALVAAGVAQLGAGGPGASRPEPGGTGAPGEPGAPRPAPAGAGALGLAAAVAAVLAATALAVVLVLPAPRAAPVDAAGAADGCNGSRALCGRRLDEAVFAGTHNSYAAAEEPGWLFANQRHGIERQLRDGIRAFLIDIHYGAPDPASGRVRTDLAGEGSSRNKVARELSPQALRTADRLVGRAGVGRPEGERRPYLCHTLCELGAEPLGEQLELFRAFLAANPSDVVILFVEPYVPVAEVERALEQTGLLAQAARIRPGAPPPTLGRLVRAGTRLVVLAEQEGGARPWYIDGFALVQDTPLGATTPAELRCARYRGSPESPLLLVNHWIPPFPPSVSRNERIGGGFLRRRLERCERRRNLVPNLIAVDFYERSAVVELARERNAS